MRKHLPNKPQNAIFGLSLFGYILFFLLNIIWINNSFADTPLWTFKPLTPTTIAVTPLSITSVDYIVTNQSTITHNISVQPFPFEIVIVDPLSCGREFTLEPQKSCILNVLIRGSDIISTYKGGPILCESGSQVLCYRPSQEDILTVIFLQL